MADTTKYTKVIVAIKIMLMFFMAESEQGFFSVFVFVTLFYPTVNTGIPIPLENSFASFS